MARTPQHMSPPPEIFALPPEVRGASCFPSRTCCGQSAAGVDSPRSGTCAPLSAASPGICETLAQLHASLGPVVESLREDPEARSLLTALQEENLHLRGRILQLEALGVSARGASPKEVVPGLAQCS